MFYSTHVHQSLLLCPNGTRFARCHLRAQECPGPPPPHWPKYCIRPYEIYYARGHKNHRSINSYSALRRNWAPPTPSPESECVSSPLGSWGGATPACGLGGGGGGPIPTKGQKLWYPMYILTPLRSTVTTTS